MSDSDKSDRSSDEVLQTLAWMRAHGFKPVALRPRSKAAITQAYADKNTEYKSPTDEFWRKNNYGVGCVTGPQNNGPLDVDLDCREAIFFAKIFMPETPAVFGRESKQASHYLYMVDVPEFRTRMYKDPRTREDEKASIIEIRGDGGSQTVFPGSLHEDTGELIWWTSGASPMLTVKTDTAIIVRGAQKVALATIIVRRVWFDGQRHDPCMYIPGMLMSYGWERDEVLQFMEAVIAWDMQENGTKLDKSWKPTIEGTIRKFEAGDPVGGAGKLSDLLCDDGLVKEIKKLAGEAKVVVVDDYNQRFACGSVEGKFRIACTEVAPGEPPTFFQIDDFKNFTATELSDVTDDKGRPLSKGRVWLSSPHRRTFNSVDFMPGEPGMKGNVLNLWTGWAIEPHSNDRECEAWLDLLHSVICAGDDDHFDWFLDWLANIVQEPMNKVPTAIVMRGEEGSGKSLLLNYFGRILGPAYIAVTDAEHIHGRFNRHSIGALLLHSEEAIFSGDRKHAAVVRSLITDETRVFEMKGVDAKKVKNYTRLVLTSNEINAAPTKPGDRRYTYFEIGYRKVHDRLVEKILKERDGTGPASLFRYLLDLDTRKRLSWTNLKTDDLIASKLSGLDVVPAWWYDRLCEGTLLSTYANWACRPEKEPWPAQLSSKALYLDAVFYARGQSRQRQMPNDNAFYSLMRRMLDQDFVKQQLTFDNPNVDEMHVPAEYRALSDRMQSIVNMPELSICRKRFERFIGQKVEWPEVDNNVIPFPKEKTEGGSF